MSSCLATSLSAIDTFSGVGVVFMGRGQLCGVTLHDVHQVRIIVFEHGLIFDLLDHALLIRNKFSIVGHHDL